MTNKTSSELRPMTRGGIVALRALVLDLQGASCRSDDTDAVYGP